jgi:hypothetical protein
MIIIIIGSQEAGLFAGLFRPHLSGFSASSIPVICNFLINLEVPFYLFYWIKLYGIGVTSSGITFASDFMKSINRFKSWKGDTAERQHGRLINYGLKWPCNYNISWSRVRKALFSFHQACRPLQTVMCLRHSQSGILNIAIRSTYMPT